MTQPPRPIGTPRTVDITGHVLAWENGEPVLMVMMGSSDRCVPIFSTVEKLVAMMMLTRIDYQSIKQIDDPLEFLDSVPPNLRVVIDPHFHENGRIRYTEILR